MIKYYQELEVWQQAMDLATDCYEISQKLPKSETYGLCSQLQRSAVSIPSNIAEGQSRQHTQEFIRFLSIARGSLAELETQILIGKRLGYFDEHHQKQLLDKIGTVGRLINGLINSLKKKVAGD